MKDSKLIWIKQVECPMCYEEFSAENIWQNKVSVVKEYPDLGKKYAGTNPLFYSVWVCPACLYADLRGDEFFNTGKINDEAFEEDYDLLNMVAGDCDFTQPRTFSLAITSYKLAIMVARYKKTSLARIATFNLRLAWLYSSIQKSDEEMRYIKYALNYFLKAFTTESEPDFGNLSHGATYYLLGELYRQTGDFKNAVKFFQRVVNDKNMNTEPKFIKQARLQWESLKDNPATGKDGDDSTSEEDSENEPPKEDSP